METPDARPLILTARLDAAAQARLDALRRQHFPPALNRLAAHLTLFHHLPAEAEDEARAACAEAAAGPAPELEVTGLRSLGRGVAFEIVSPALERARATVAARFAGRLTPQDGQRFRPHVTVQNKVTPDEAKALKAKLEAEFAPFEARAEALTLWRYDGGPWAWAAETPFRG